MTPRIETDIDLTNLTTLGIAATARQMTRTTHSDQLPAIAAYATQHNIPIWPLGSGSNVVIGQPQLNALVLKIEIPGREVIDTTDTHTDIRIGAGENWDDLVAWSVQHNLHGIESLSLIPGTVGAAPVQNIGAYGQELHETLLHVEAFDLTTNRIVTLTSADCQFAYRNSMFKHAGKHRYIITAVTLRLVPAEHTEPPTYAALQAQLAERHIHQPTVADIREAVIAVRQSKLPDPTAIPTAGSFFHNPIVSAEFFQDLEVQHPDIPHWPTADGRIKLSGAWLIESCGFKGKIENGVGMYDKQALCLVNPGYNPAEEVLAFRDRVVDAVNQAFGVRLVMEPELIAL